MNYIKQINSHDQTPKLGIYLYIYMYILIYIYIHISFIEKYFLEILKKLALEQQRL